MVDIAVSSTKETFKCQYIMCTHCNKKLIGNQYGPGQHKEGASGRLRQFHDDVSWTPIAQKSKYCYMFEKLF